MSGVQMYGWSPDDKKWVKLQLDSDGSIHVVGYVDSLDDIGDVNVPTPTDGHYFYWDAGASEWKSKSVAADAVAAVEAAGLALAAGKKIIIANDGVIQLGTLDGSPTIRGGRAAHPSMLIVQPKDGDKLGEICVIPSGTHTQSYYCLYNSSDLENYGYVDFTLQGTSLILFGGKVGTGNLPTIFRISFSPLPTENEGWSLGAVTYRWLESWVMHRQLVHKLPVDHTWTGDVAEMYAGTALTIGQACYVGGDGKMELADADLATTMPVMALCTPETLAEDAKGQFLLRGFFRDDTWDWTPRGIIYASVTPGGLSQTAPVGSGDQVQVVGVAMSADIIHFNPSYELVEIS